MKQKISEQAKMNSSDWSGLHQEDSDGFIQVRSRSSKKMLRKKQKLQEKDQSEEDSSRPASDRRSRSGSASRPQSRSSSQAARSRSHSRGSDVGAEEEVPASPADYAIGQAVDPGQDDPADGKEKRRRSRSSSRTPKNCVVPETPRGEHGSSGGKKGTGKSRVIKVNAADGKTLETLATDAIQNGKSPKPRDIDPSSKPPTPALVCQVAEMLIEDSTTALPVELGIRSTARREAALKRLKRVLQIKCLDAEKLLTCSALTHDHGKESYAHALALGKYFKYGAQVEDGAEEHRFLLRKQLHKLGYKVEQVDLALTDLEASLGVFNISASEVHGWLMRQALAFDENQQRHMARDKHCDDATPPRVGQADARSHVCKGQCCEQGQKKLEPFQKVDHLLRIHGMVDAAMAIRQTAIAQSPSSKLHSAPATGRGAQALSNTGNNLQQEKGVVLSTPSTRDRYHKAEAVSTLRKMLREDPELGNLPVEQQLRIAARRINRRIDFDEVPAKESRANKRTAGERVNDDDEDEDSVPSAKGEKRKPAFKAKQSNARGGDESPPSSGSSEGSGSEDSPGGSSDGSDNDVGSDDDEEDSDSAGSSCGSDDDDSRESEQQYDTKDGFCVDDDEVGADGKLRKAKKEGRKQPKQDDVSATSSANKRASSINSLGTPKKSEGTSSVSQGGNIYFGEDELKKWTTGSEKYKQGFNWPAYIHHKQNYDNYCQFKGVHAARTFKSVVHARLVPALCGFCGLRRGLWKEYEDATVILAIEKALRPSKSTDFALELKQIKIADDKELSLMQNYTAFFENFSYKVAEAEDANRTIKPNVVKSTFKAAVAGHEILKLWLEEVPWRGLNKANARLLRKLREVRSWEQLQRKGITSAAKKQRTDDDDAVEARTCQEGKKSFRGKRAGKTYALKKRTVKFTTGRKARTNYGASNSSDNMRPFSKSKESSRGSEVKRKHSGLDQRGESWHDNQELFECFHSPCQAPFCQRCGRHGHTASECRIPDDAPGINLRGYYQEEKKGKARIAGPPPRSNVSRGDDDSEDAESENSSGKNNAQRGSNRRCLH
jgi:hypothetical protein